ncbi:MAG: hypothetical protein KatS3mg113_1052 [Planctomycetaceae bacterium]|nr:MAG: hypothetical protein KatS3mg113_1052 [Planctomycetaceae bacterium]
MKVAQFLDHHQLTANPFSFEDAQADLLFQRHCSRDTFHPAWDKILGQLESPATSVVFGEKGSGKTALRIQIVQQCEEFNQQHPQRRIFVVEYDDFNPFLDAYQQRLNWWQRSPQRALSRIRLWDHMDAILSLAITRLLDLLIDESADVDLKQRAEKMSATAKRDLLLLATCYDRSRKHGPEERLLRLRQLLRTEGWRERIESWWPLMLGGVTTLGLLSMLVRAGELRQLEHWWPWLIVLAAWIPWLIRHAVLLRISWSIRRQLRMLERRWWHLYRLFARFTPRALQGQPIPTRERSDDRYALLSKLQQVLHELGYEHLLVVIDRLDEPHLINGSAERMKLLLWPLLDNKFLKHPRMALKLLLPSELSYYLLKENRDFYERSRLDKQHLIRSLEWTGESLYDLANDRLRAVAVHPSTAAQLNIRNWFEPSITPAELIAIFGRLRVPRHLFKFLHRLLIEHCQRYVDQQPRWEIGRETLQATLAVFLRELDLQDRGMGTG